MYSVNTWSMKHEILDNVAEWLRRWIANPLDFVRVSSNLTIVFLGLGLAFFIGFTLFDTK